MSRVTNLVKAIHNDQRGYGMAELMLIIAVLGMVAIGVSGTLRDKLDTAASSVGSNIDALVNKWTKDK